MDVLGMVQSEPSKFTFGESFTLIALSFPYLQTDARRYPAIGCIVLSRNCSLSYRFTP
jgi:hypothetical protein